MYTRQMMMSAWMVLTCVLLMLPATILMVVMTVSVTLAMREMGSIVQVSFMCMYHDSTYIISFLQATCTRVYTTHKLLL